MLSFAVRQSRLLVPFLVSLCLFAPLRAQDSNSPPPQEDEVVRVSAELVQTDVMVFDRGGKFVDGLQPEQFELKVDGRAAPISFFERVEAGTVDEDAQLAAARGGGARPNTRPAGAPVPLDRGRTVIFFVDDLHLSPASAARARQALLRFIDEKLGQNDEAAVASASGQIGFLQQFTDNRAVLRAAVERLRPRAYNASDGQSPPMSEAHALAVTRGDPAVISFFVDALRREVPNITRETAENMVSARAQTITRQSQYVADNTLYSLESLVRYSAPLPGRKLLFFISDGFLLDTHEGNSRERMRRVTDAAARAGVVIYSMDAAGLRSGTADAATEAAFDSGGRLSSTDSGALRGSQEPLHTLAADTGGRALVNTNAMGPAVEGALKETARYYLLAWRPEGEGPRGAARFRRIEVSVRGRKDLQVIVRRGFYGGSAPEERRPEEAKQRKREEAKSAAQKSAPAESAADRELRAALGSLRPRAALPTSVSLGFLNTQEQGTVLTASVGLDREALPLFEVRDGERARVDLLGVIYDDRGRFVTGFRHGLAFDPREAAERPQDRVMHTYQFKLEPGLFQVRVATRDRKTGRTGSALDWIEVPSFKEPRFALSSIFLAERAGGEPPPEFTPENASAGVLFNVNRRFSRASWMRFATFVYHASKGAAAQPDVALQVQIFRDDQPVFTAPLAKVRVESSSDPARIPYAAELPLETFPAGRYALQLTAIDRHAKATTTQRINFVIE
jgi:VWFA-related protein